VKLTPEDQSKLRDKGLANIIRKLNGGTTLTAREEAKLEAATADFRCCQRGRVRSSPRGGTSDSGGASVTRNRKSRPNPTPPPATIEAMIAPAHRQRRR
jgi:hypothetical protein